MKNNAEQPIGIFDSGIGGLTVASAVQRALPLENLIYFGDTAHFPYGDKSTAAIQAYAIKICDVLIRQHCKVILIACNSASSAAYQLAKEYVGSKAKVMNVIDPVIAYVSEHHDHKTIGLIGTKKTVNSNVYQRKIDKLGKHITLKSLATPLLAPLIEEGYFDQKISETIINGYLSDHRFSDIQALILGCTHYPLIKNEINKFYEGKVEVIDTSDIFAAYLCDFLTTHHLLRKERKEDNKFFVSDYTHSFAESTKMFFKEEVHLEYYPLWD